MNTDFFIISTIIKNRRSIKPVMMKGNKIPSEQIKSLLELANWAPTHGFTEPWRFVVYATPPEFCRHHAEMYKQNTDAENFVEAVYNNLFHQGDKASHVIIALMRRGDLPKIPVVEEIEAVSCAIQNILLGATALGIASFWSTGGLALKPPMRAFLHLGAEDHLVGVLYLGYTDEHPKGRRQIPIEEKIKWFE
jgi:nitroreductase